MEIISILFCCCCYILFSLLPWGSGNHMFVFALFWFMFPFVAVFLTDPPDWVPDEVCSYCTACKAPFTVIRRKHHCRSCGKVMTQSDMWELPTKESSKFMCTTATQLHSKMCRVLNSQVLLCAWAANSHSLYLRVGEWFDFYTAISCIKLKAEFPVESTPRPNTESLWTPGGSFNEPGQPALPGVMHSQLSCRDSVSLCFLCKTFAGSLWCVGLLLGKFVGVEEGVREKKVM